MDQPLMPGDLIEIDRVRFKHWAVCIGNGEVVHLVALIDVTNAMTDTEGEVRREHLKDVCGKSFWRVNNDQGLQNKPRTAAQIVQDALSWVDETVTYNLATYNCEHFATQMRYGRAVSQQKVTLQVVDSVKKVGLWAGLMGPLGSAAVSASSLGSAASSP
ncbi:phospholipase A and acyltransferase 4-like isoform X2 [Genypterus blacodes]|uniref:phospholipase A and acyltransferase 4-like isoform X2 n=1 Tax=Genypterus blacodes TaxID=154954 RepID=UPI003F762314